MWKVLHMNINLVDNTLPTVGHKSILLLPTENYSNFFDSSKTSKEYVRIKLDKVNII